MACNEYFRRKMHPQHKTEGLLAAISVTMLNACLMLSVIEGSIRQRALQRRPSGRGECAPPFGIRRRLSQRFGQPV